MAEQELFTVSVDSELQDLIPEFMDLTKKDIEQMTYALEKEDFETVRRLGHTMKGSGAGYGFELLTEVGANIEQLAKTKAGSDIKPLIAKATDYLQKVKIVFK